MTLLAATSRYSITLSTETLILSSVWVLTNWCELSGIADKCLAMKHFLKRVLPDIYQKCEENKSTKVIMNCVAVANSANIVNAGRKKNDL